MPKLTFVGLLETNVVGLVMRITSVLEKIWSCVDIGCWLVTVCSDGEDCWG
jgi:hypothetical protein